MALLKLSVCCATLVLAVNTVSQAQERIDMSKFTCEQMLTGSGECPAKSEPSGSPLWGHFFVSPSTPEKPGSACGWTVIT